MLQTITALEGQLGQMAAQLQEQEAVTSGLNGELTALRERAAHAQDSQDLTRQVKVNIITLSYLLTFSPTLLSKEKVLG